MNNNRNRPLDEEFRSSQVYKTLTGTGFNVAGKIAQGLEKAAGGIDSALNSFAAGAGQNPNPSPNGGQPSYQGYPPQGQNGAGQNGRGNPPPQNGRPVAPPPVYQAPPQYRPPKQKKNGYYQYQYTQQPRTTQTAQANYRAPNPAQGAPSGGNVPPPYRPAQPSQQGYQAPNPANVRRPGNVQPTPAPKMPRMKVVRRGSAAKFYITGVTALMYALMLPMYEPMHFAIFAVVEVCIFLLSGVLFKGKKEFVPIEEEKPKEEPKEEEEQKPSKTGNPEVDKLIDEGNEYLKKLRAANDAIPDESLSECIERMERSASDIFRYIGDHPEKASQIRKFMNYYLPTTLKLLDSYERLSRQSVKGETITSTMFNIAGMMHTVADAFENQLDSLFSDEAMDISADITVFESMLKQEGFVEENKKD